MNAALYNFFSNMYVIQAIGFVAFGFGVSAFLCRNDRKLKILLTAQCLVLTVHFYLLGASAAPYITAISAVRNISSLIGKAKPLAWGFVAAYLAIGYYRYDEWVDILPIVSPVVSTYGLFYLKGIRMRLCFLFATSCWIVHNFVVVSIGPFFMELFIFSANAFTILRISGVFRKFKKA